MVQASLPSKYVPGSSRVLLLVLVALALPGTELQPQEPSPYTAKISAESYVEPPAAIMEGVLAPWHEHVTLNVVSPDGRWALHTQPGGLPQLASLSKPYLDLGGIHIAPRANRLRKLRINGGTAIKLINLEDAGVIDVETPSGARFGHAQWSPDGARIAFFAHYADETHIYVADVEQPRARRITRTPVLATLTHSFQWSADGRYIFTILVPRNRKDEPVSPARPTEPLVYITGQIPGARHPRSSLLRTPHEIRLLEHHATGQLARIQVDRRRVHNIGRPGMIRDFDASPDGLHIRVRRLQPPYSYHLPVSLWGSVDMIWDMDGNVLAELARRWLGEPDPEYSGPGTGLPTESYHRHHHSRRRISWRPDGKGLSFLQREPHPASGNGNMSDRVMQWLPPYGSDDLNVVYRTEESLQAVHYSREPDELLFLTYESGDRFAVFLRQPDSRYPVKGGELLWAPSPSGIPVVRVSSDWRYVYITGKDHCKLNFLEEAPRPWVDRIELGSGQRERLFQSQPDVYEQLLAVLDDDFRYFITTRETAASVPNSYLRQRERNSFRRLTDNVDHTPELTEAQTRYLQATREDGVRFWIRLILPADWVPGSPLPAVFWMEPASYENQAEYHRSKHGYNVNAFRKPGPHSLEHLLREGYAVVLPDMPFMKEESRSHSHRLTELTMNLTAAVEELAASGLIDKRRLAVGGHGHGALEAVNAMIHTRLFRAGIAGSGVYNLTLEPAGSQSVPKSIWEAPHAYMERSALFHAHQLHGAILLYAGRDGGDPGNASLNSYSLFNALHTLGRAAALYVYPAESHLPAARETVLDLWARRIAWLDHYVMKASTPAGTEAESRESPGGH